MMNYVCHLFYALTNAYGKTAFENYKEIIKYVGLLLNLR